MVKPRYHSSSFRAGDRDRPDGDEHEGSSSAAGTIMIGRISPTFTMMKAFTWMRVLQLFRKNHYWVLSSSFENRNHEYIGHILVTASSQIEALRSTVLGT